MNVLYVSTTQHPFYCGIALHARTMYVCILDPSGEVLVHRNRKTNPKAFVQRMAPSREGLVVAGACMFPWSWLADLWADEGLPVVLGPALSMQAIHGGKATNDPIDSHKIAALLRGGLLPQAYVAPAQMRATRALLRRRMPRTPTRAALLAPVQQTTRQSNLPAIGTTIASTTNREGVADRCAEPAGHKRIAADLARITSYDEVLRDVDRTIGTTATHHDATTRSLLHTVPGIGKLLRLVLRYASPHSNRFPRGQEFVSSCRLVQCATAAGGQHWGASGATSGQAPLTWTFSEAAVLVLRDHPAAQTDLACLENKPAKGQALTILAHKLPVPSLTCSNARWLSIGIRSSSQTGGERRSLAAHWTTKG